MNDIGLTLKSPLTPEEMLEAKRVGLLYNPNNLTINIDFSKGIARHEYNYYINQYKRVRLDSLYNKYNDDFTGIGLPKISQVNTNPKVNPKKVVVQIRLR